MSEEDRIRLAEEIWGSKDGTMKRGNPSFEYFVRFDPFTDANDDYAVLCWLREYSDRAEAAFQVLENMSHDGMPAEWSLNYEIGDYARAALEVLNES